MLPEEEIVRICALVVLTATGVDVLRDKAVVRGSPDLQKSRALWVHLVVCEFNITRGRASYLCDRSLESIDRYLGEIEEWRTDLEFSDSLDRWGESAKQLMALTFDFTRLIPNRRTRAIAKAAVRERAVA